MERHENVMLKEDNNRLRNENQAMRTKLSRPICLSCGGLTVANGTAASYEEHQLKLENAQLRDEITRICTLTNKFLGKSLSPFARSVIASGPPHALSSRLDNVAIPVGGVGPSSLVFPEGISIAPPAIPMTKPIIGATEGISEALHKKSMFLDLAFSAMSELIKMAQSDAPLWTRSFDGAREVLNHEEYMRTFSPHIGFMVKNFVPEGSREMGVVLINSLAAVDILMDVVRTDMFCPLSCGKLTLNSVGNIGPVNLWISFEQNRWAGTFQSMITRASTVDMISDGSGGSPNGALQVVCF